MHRIFVNPQYITSDKITLQGESLRKVSRVLRLKPGDRLWVFDGTGIEYLIEIVSLTPSEGEFKVVSTATPVRESPLEIHLGQALPKAQKMDFIVQKAVELGVSAIHPFYSTHTIPAYKADQVDRRVRRWQKIAQEASQQSGRTRVPRVNVPMGFPQLLDFLPRRSIKIILQKETAHRTLRDVLEDETARWQGITKGDRKAHFPVGFSDAMQMKSDISFLVGPEGGFTREEIALSVNQGFIPVSLGERILRTETVAIAFLSIIQYEWGDIH